MNLSSILQQRRQQTLILILLLTAIVGPWTYTPDGAPPAELCEKPFFLTADGRCGSLVYGTNMLLLVSSSFVNLFFAIIGGSAALGDRWVELLGSLLIMLLALPVISTVLEFRQEPSVNVQRFRTAAWTVGAALSVLGVVWFQSTGSLRYWGLWLYLAVCWAVFTSLIGTAISNRFSSGNAA